ncbi:uncharacterized protein BDR25DRAFT_350734 [Lindgomyces ingoldianus]|uniref:Uncharacterized protein n=1 Tax=Lindgomyces ingoldianus TaxID=673940 RepID=A0ACB6R7V4_9PLEO|nr:uncharacterized protein BDR25DRAFT_350734 [Lindgomyces ingoldianus]KAF2475348.1 hypothetical protein BDR25DRAFT_350734 [Lindgomyces ingoldianus]
MSSTMSIVAMSNADSFHKMKNIYHFSSFSYKSAMVVDARMSSKPKIFEILTQSNIHILGIDFKIASLPMLNTLWMILIYLLWKSIIRRNDIEKTVSKPWFPVSYLHR